MNRNVFHIGFFHSASTLLQKNIFNNISGYNFVNYDKKLIDKSISYMPKNFGKYFYYEKNDIFRALKKYKKPFIYSSEAFSHLHEHNSYYKIKLYNENPFIGIVNLARFLFESNSHLLFIIRNQTSVINSYFKRWSNLYKSEDDLFIDFPYKRNLHKSKRTLAFSKFGMLYLNTFNYRLNLSIILNFIDKSKIHIIPYEYLLNDKKKFITNLGKVFNKDLNFLEGKLLEKINSSKGSLGKPLSKKYKKLLKDEFAYDNKILDKTFNLGLKKLGYY